MDFCDQVNLLMYFEIAAFAVCICVEFMCTTISVA